MNKKKQLGQYFTPSAIASSLVGRLQTPVESVLELGSGNGRLGLALLEKHPNAKYIGFERDCDYYNECKKNLPNHQILQADVLDGITIEKIKSFADVDTVIGNPPFIVTELTNDKFSVLQEFFPDTASTAKSVRAELVFLAQSLSKLKRGGQASFILPSNFFTSEVYRFFRENILERFSEIAVLELPYKAFQSAEVSTCILSFRNLKSNSKYITVGQLNITGTIIDTIKVSKASALTRMDYAFHKLIHEFDEKSFLEAETLGFIGGTVKRGSGSRARIELNNIKCFHTTSFPKSSQTVSLGDDYVGDFRFASEGDILTARVGSRCLERQVLVGSGTRAITDCVYKIRVNQSDVDRVMRTLSSNFGKAWRVHNAKGSCAKYITNKSLLDMPIFPS